MTEWDGAVREGLAEPLDDLAEAVRDELRQLWNDLSNARRFALNGRWSGGWTSSPANGGMPRD